MAPWFLRAALAATLALCTAPMAGAVSISPTSVLLEADDARPVRVRVTAPPTSPLALDLQVLERHADGEGESTRPPGAPSFELHPPQLFVPAGGSADIVLRWTGTLPTEGSRSFHLVADQLPIAVGSAGSADEVRLLARIHLPMHVARGGAARLEVATTGEGASRRVIVANHGSRYARLASLALRLARADGTTRALPGLELARLARSDALLPRGRLSLDATALGLAPDEQAIALEARP